MDRVSEILICSLRIFQPQGLSTNWNLSVPHAQCHLSRWERSDRLGDPGEGLRPNDRPEPLTPTLSHRSRIYPTSTDLKRPTRINPSWVGEGARRHRRDTNASIQANRAHRQCSSRVSSKLISRPTASPNSDRITTPASS